MKTQKFPITVAITGFHNHTQRGLAIVGSVGYGLVKATINEGEEDVSKMMDRIIDHTGIREIYPMIGKVIVKEIEPLNSVFFFFQLNDPSIDGENMYKKGFDPHYLIDRHLKKYLGLFGFKNKKVGYIVAAPDGEVIDTYVV